MKTMKYLGCLLALVFATNSLYAKSTAFTEWFATTIATELASEDGAWTNTAGWDFSKTDYNLNNWSSNTSLTFTVTTPKTLPGDVAAIKTTVKFTAMDLADFNDMEASTWAGAKAGLTVVETATDTYTYYGIVSGQWEALTGKPDLEHELDVKVTLSKNGTSQFVKYEVGQTGGELTALTLNSASEIATSSTDATISSVSYKGLCKLTALSGEGAKSIFDLTVPNKPNATAVVKVNGEVFSSDTGVYAITSGVGAVSVEYKPVNGYKVYGQQPADIAALEGNMTLAVPADLDSRLIIAYVGDTLAGDLENAYDTFAGAIGDENAGKVTLLQNSAEDVAIGKALTIAGNKKLSGTITVNGALTIEGCEFDNKFVFGDAGSVSFKGGIFDAYSKDDVQGYCATGFFAEALTSGTGCQVVVGTKQSIELPGGETIEISFDPNETTPEKLAATAGNNKPGWVNYALGLDADATDDVKIAKAEADATGVALCANGKAPRSGTGYTMVVKEGDSELEDAVLPLEVGDHPLKMYLKKDKVLTECGEVTVTVSKPQVSAYEKQDVKFVTVPYNQINGEAMTLDEVINTANLNVGAKLNIYNGNDYDEYELDADRKWNKVKEAGGLKLAAAAAPIYVNPGQGLWLKTTASDFFQYGVKPTKSTAISLNVGWNLIGSATGSINLSKIKGAQVGDYIRVEKIVTESDIQTLKPVEYLSDGASWYTWEIAEKQIGSRTIKTTKQIPVAGDVIEVGGNGVWYFKSAEGEASISL